MPFLHNAQHLSFNTGQSYDHEHTTASYKAQDLYSNNTCICL